MISSSTTISTIQPIPATNFLANATRNIETYYNNTTNDSVSIEERKEEIPNRLMFALILQSGILVVFLGNALVLAALACYRTWTTTDVLLFSLSTADLLNSIVGVELITVVKYFLGRPMGKLLCDVFIVSVYCFRTASATTVTGIAMERAILFIYPLKHHIMVTTPCTKKIVAGIWFFSIVFGFLPFIGVGHPGFQNGKCFYQMYDLGIEFTILVEIYGALMLLAVFASYIAIKLSGAMFIRRQTQMAGCGDKRQRSESEQSARMPTDSVGTTRRTSAMRTVQRLALMMSIVVIVYFITWLPFLLHNLYCLIVNEHPSTKVAFLTSIISFLHAVVNPPLYGWMSQRYRRGYFFVFKMVLSVCGGRRPPRRSLSENHGHYIPTNMKRQLSAAEIDVQRSMSSLPKTERAPTLIKENKDELK